MGVIIPLTKSFVYAVSEDDLTAVLFDLMTDAFDRISDNYDVVESRVLVSSEMKEPFRSPEWVGICFEAVAL